MKFTEAKLEEAIIELLGVQGYPHLTSANRQFYALTNTTQRRD